MKMSLHILLVPVVFLLLVPRGVDSIECYSCSNVSDIESCFNTSVCSNGQSCFTNSVTSGRTTTYTFGCTEKQQCVTLSHGSPGLIGRDIAVRQTICHECCSSERCNNQLCNHPKPTACIDDAKVDCAYMNAMFNICQDIHHSKNVCPKFCDLCTLVDGNWADWSQWSECDVTCENGFQTRKRTCTNPAPVNDGLDCVGNGTDTKPCVKQPCPIHGGWAVWSDWEVCSVTCDNGIQIRHRNCSNPYPSRFGDHCFGDTMDARLCMIQACANGGWSTWDSWTSCSATCDGGIRSQSRTCTNPRPSPQGKFCEGDSLKVAVCNTKPCNIIDGNLTNSLTSVPNVAFNVYHLTDLSPTVGQTMIFKTVLLNDGSGYSPSTGKFTAPVQGTYSFNAHICFASNNYLYFDIKVGSATIASGYGYSTNGNTCHSAQAVAFVRKNDKVFVQWTILSYSSSNKILDNVYARNVFSGVLLHQ